MNNVQLWMEYSTKDQSLLSMLHHDICFHFACLCNKTFNIKVAVDNLCFVIHCTNKVQALKLCIL